MVYGRLSVGALCGLTAAVVWALSTAIYQPFMQPSGVWTDSDTGQTYPQLGGNNTYWPRDTRELAILLALVGVVVICRANLRGVLVGAIATGIWLMADVWLDRLDVSGRSTATWLAVIGGVGFAAVATIAARVSAGRVGAPVVHHLSAVAAAALGAMTVLVTTPWEEPVTRSDQVRVEDALTVMKVGLGVMFAVAALALVATRPTAVRAGRAAVWAALAGLTAWLDATSNGVLGVALLVVAAALLVTAAAWDVSLPRLGAVAGACILVLFVVGIPLAFAGIAVGGALTSLAGNPPINSADTDLSLGFVGLTSALLVAAVSYAVVRWRQPRVATPQVRVAGEGPLPGSAA